VPGAAKQIITWAEQQTQHRIDLEKKVVDAEIKRSKSGLLAGFALSLIMVALGSWLVYLGHDWAGGTIAVSTITGLAGVFVYGTSQRRAERQEKAKILRGQT
jgi:uncharacterized membrane protein